MSVAIIHENLLSEDNIIWDRGTSQKKKLLNGKGITQDNIR